jgi:hypothetical protein
MHGTPAAWNQLHNVMVHNPCCGATMLVNRALLDLALPIPDNVVMHDWWLALCASAYGKLIQLQDPLLLYRQHGGNVLGAKTLLAKLARGSLSEIPKALQRLKATCVQAQLLCDRAGSKMDPEHREALQAYADILHGKRRVLSTLWRYGLWKPQLYQRAAQVIGLTSIQRRESLIRSQWLSQAVSKSS